MIDRPVAVTRAAIEHWFYGLEFSPTVVESVQKIEVDRFLELLQSIIADSSVYKVQVTPPI